jgi:hypothetical protein
MKKTLSKLPLKSRIALRTGLYSPNLSKWYFLQIHTNICSKVPIFYFNRPKRPPIYITFT